MESILSNYFQRSDIQRSDFRFKSLVGDFRSNRSIELKLNFTEPCQERKDFWLITSSLFFVISHKLQFSFLLVVFSCFSNRFSECKIPWIVFEILKNPSQPFDDNNRSTNFANVNPFPIEKRLKKEHKKTLVI